MQWKIDWNKLITLPPHDNKLYSEKFEVATYYWRLLAFINPQNQREVPHLSLFLDAPEATFTPHHMNPTADFTLKLINQRDESKSFHKGKLEL